MDGSGFPPAARRGRWLAGLGGAAVLALGVLPLSAHAASREECTDAYMQAQVLRKQGKLVGARDQLRVCVRAECPRLIVNDCSQWLDDVQAGLPSFVPIALDEAGENLLDVKVSLDGSPLAASLAGKAVEVDPGTHHLTFERADLSPSETDVLLVVGDKDKRVTVTLHKTAPDPSAAQPLPERDSAALDAGQSDADTPSPGESAQPSKPWSPYLTTGIVVGSVGLAGLVVGSIFGVEAMTKQSAANCPGNVCRAGSTPGDLQDAKSDGNLSTAFFVAGGVLVAAGVATWFLAPAPHPGDSAWVRPLPIVSTGGGGLGIVGGWQ